MNLFPRTLDRIPYLVRWLVLSLVVGIIEGALVGITMALMPADQSSSPGAVVIILGILAFLVFVAAIAYAIMALTIPRIRSCGWSPWLALILLIPGVGGIFSIVLLFMPPVENSGL